VLPKEEGRSGRCAVKVDGVLPELGPVGLKGSAPGPPKGVPLPPRLDCCSPGWATPPFDSSVLSFFGSEKKRKERLGCERGGGKLPSRGL